MNFCLLFIALVQIIQIGEARKSYMIKDGIQQGHIKVHQPRVQAVTTEWCWFKDSDNDFCITVTENWKVGMANSYDYQQDTTSSSAPANYKQVFEMYSTQSAVWVSKFNLKRLFFNQFTFSLKEFTAGIKFEVINWLTEYAWCFNVALFIKPITIDLISRVQVEECQKVLIQTLEDSSNWVDLNEAFLEKCGLSSGSDIIIYQYVPIVVEYTKYFLGKESFQLRYCWPGKSPFYSYFDQYPANPVYAIYKMIFAYDKFKDIQAASKAPFVSNMIAGYQALQYGLDFQNKGLEGPIQRNMTQEDMYNHMANDPTLPQGGEIVLL